MDMSHDTRLTTRFFKKVEKTESCHNWIAGKDTGGYGIFRISDRNRPAHRIAYELAYGPFDQAMHVDHICHNHACVNPKHLRLVTRVQNAENRKGAAKHNKTGIRGVTWHKPTRKWRVQVGHNGTQNYGGLYLTLEEAEKAAIALRNQLHTHNYIDRLAS